MQDSGAPQIGWKAASKTGIVAAGAAEAVAAGIEILDSGGNAADAAVATILALNVTDHGACSIGGGSAGSYFRRRKTGSEVAFGPGRRAALSKIHRLVYEKWHPRFRHQDGARSFGG